VFLVLGNFTYNEVIEWKLFGINKDMSKYRNQKQMEEEITNFGTIEGADEDRNKVRPVSYYGKNNKDD